MRHRLEDAGVRAVRALVRVLPTAVVRALGAALGLTFYALDGVHRRVADANLAMAFPARTPAERRRITRAMFVHFGRLLFELLRFSALAPDAMRRRIEFEDMTRKIETIPTMAPASVPVMLFQSCMMLSEPKMPKLSSSLGAR